MKTHLFIDLEDTVIKSWDDQALINIDTIKRHIAEIKPDFVHIYSAAIWYQRDVDNFNSGLKSVLERELGVTFEPTMSIAEFKRKTSWATLDVSTGELLLTIGKFRLFLDICKTLFKNSRCVLLDDMCDNEITVSKTHNVEIEMIRIENEYIQMHLYGS